MKIAYSCAGEGFGHAARVAALLPHLSRHNLVEVFCPDTVRAFLRSKVPLLPLRPIPGLLFSRKGEEVRYWATLLKNLAHLFLFFPTVLMLARTLRKEGFQGVVSDYEPYLAWAGWLAGLRVVQLNHPGIIMKFMEAKWQSVIACTTAWLMEGPWHQRIHCSFFAGDVGPILRPSLNRLKPSLGGHWVVNIKPEFRQDLATVLAGFPGVDFRVFPDPGANYEEALRDCRGVIAHAGHQTLSESLSLGKIVLAIPQRRQWEQELNARMVVASGRGLACSMEGLAEGLRAFLAAEEDLRQALGSTRDGFAYADGTLEAARRILEGLGCDGSSDAEAARPGTGAAA